MSLDQDVYEELRQQDWADLGRKLVAYAAFLSANYGWKALDDDTAVVKGIALEDVVGEVIASVIEGKREWNPKRGPLLTFLKAGVWSEITHLASCAERKRVVSMPRDEDDLDLLERLELRAAHNPNGRAVVSTQRNPEQQVLDAEVEAIADRKINRLMEAIEDKPDLQAVLDTILEEGDARPRFLARRMDLSIGTVNNRLKRLRRRAVR